MACRPDSKAQTIAYYKKIDACASSASQTIALTNLVHILEVMIPIQKPITGKQIVLCDHMCKTARIQLVIVRIKYKP